MRIRLTSIFVDDQEKALRFYTDILGFQAKADVKQGPYRWLTVASPEEPDGVELQLALNDDPVAKTFQEANFERSQPATSFYVDDVQAEYDRLSKHGVEFTTEPVSEDWGSMAVLNDTCGNLIQITQLSWQG